MLDLKPEIEKLFAKYEKDFRLDEITAEIEGEQGVRFAQDLRKQFRLLRVHVIECRESIDEDEAEELKELIANKLALGSKTAEPNDWWWTPAEPTAQKLLKSIQRTLEKATEKKSRAWRRWLRYAWKLFVELAYLAVVVGVFSVATTKFETIVMAVLVMIYNATKGVGAGVGVTLAYLASGLENAYGEIGRSLRLKVPVSPSREAEKRVSEVGVDILVHGISMGIGTLIAMWKIVATLLE